jgi:2'-5' RNA ligase
MGFEPNGVPRIPAEQRLNVFALVIYIPDPLGRFLDDLRRDLVPGCNPHAHVSVLPPRPLAGDWQVAGEQVRSLTEAWSPFEIVLGDICIFPVTNVIYIELSKGADEMDRLHAGMNSDALHFDEPFAYHPHVTLAQEITGESVAETHRKARELWKAYTGPRSFRAERAAFVQNTLGNCWVDLAEYSLGAAGDMVAGRR